MSPMGEGMMQPRASRVVPAMGETMARSELVRALRREDLPTLGRPVKTTVGRSKSLSRRRGAELVLHDVAEQLREFPVQRFGGDETDILFIDEIDAGLDAGEEGGDFFGGGGDPLVEVAGAEGGRGTELGFVGGVDGGGDTFCLGEVDFSVEEGAGGEFAGVGEAGGDVLIASVCEELVQEGLEEGGGVGEVEFGDVFAGEAVGGAKEEEGGEFGVGVEEGDCEGAMHTDGFESVGCCVGGEDGMGEGPGVGTAEAEDSSYPATAPHRRRGTDGEDGVGEVHGRCSMLITAR